MGRPAKPAGRSVVFFCRTGAIVPVRGYLLALCLALVVLGAGGCASAPGRGPGMRGAGPPPSNRNADQASEGWLQSGADSLAAAQQTLRAALHRVYQAWAGTPYLYGGQTKDGVDCSSFVRQTVDQVDSYELPRTTVEQARVGMSISRTELQTGDLVFFKTGVGMHHVGIYLGNGRFMHASSSQGVTISRLDNSYWRRHYWQSRRVVADTADGAGLSQL